MAIITWLIAIIFTILLVVLFAVTLVALGIATLIGCLPAPVVSLIMFLFIRKRLQKRKTKTRQPKTAPPLYLGTHGKQTYLP